jgi:hypothetical protein
VMIKSYLQVLFWFVPKVRSKMQELSYCSALLRVLYEIETYGRLHNEPIHNEYS